MFTDLHPVHASNEKSVTHKSDMNEYPLVLPTLNKGLPSTWVRFFHKSHLPTLACLINFYEWEPHIHNRFYCLWDFPRSIDIARLHININIVCDWSTHRHLICLVDTLCDAKMGRHRFRSQGVTYSVLGELCDLGCPTETHFKIQISRNLFRSKLMF